MLENVKLTRIARIVGDNLSEAHRGVLPAPRTGTLLAFGNDGAVDEPVGQSAIRNTSVILAAEGFVVGDVVTGPDRYTWVFEVRPPRSRNLTVALRWAEFCVWEGWAAARNLDLDCDSLALVQRRIAQARCGGFDIEKHLNYGQGN